MFLTPRNGNNNTMRFAITTTSYWDESQATSAQVLPTGWHHVAVVVDGGSSVMSLYLDGAAVIEYVATNTLPGNLGVTTQNWLGRSQYAADSYFNGMLDNFIIYDYAMSPEQIRALMAANEATIPNPPNYAANVSGRPTLSWQSGRYATEHQLYFSDNFNDVNDRTVTPVILYETSYTLPEPPAPLESQATYYWAVDETNWQEVWKGNVWRFTVRDYSVIDNFEKYTETGSPGGSTTALRRTWLDGYVGVGYKSWNYPNPPVPDGSSGSYVQLDNDPCDGNTIQTEIVQLGLCSMKFYYDNDSSVAWLVTLYKNDPYYTYPAPMYSEVSAAIDDAARLTDSGRGLSPANQSSLEMNRDWTEYSILRIGYYGGIDNTKTASDRMYVGLEDGDGTIVTINNPDTDAVIHQGWHNWYIRLKDFNAINPNLDMTNLKRFYIGVGNRISQAAGGRGAMFFDEIQLLKGTVCAPVNPSNTEVTPLATDFSADCNSTAADLQYLTRMWLWQGNPSILPDANCVIRLNASTLSLGPLSSWTNTGTAVGHFVDYNSLITGRRPTVKMVEGVQAVLFDGNDCLVADINTPATIAGNLPFTIIYKIWNESFSGDEELFTWAKRGTDNRAAAVSFGDGTNWEAAAYWGPGDVTFGTYQPAAHQWHTVAQVYQGGTNGRYYIITDGKINSNVARSLDIWPNCYMTVGMALDGDPYLLRRWQMTPNAGTALSNGAISELKVYNLYTDPGALALWMNSPVNLAAGDVPEIIDFKDAAVFANDWMASAKLGN